MSDRVTIGGTVYETVGSSSSNLLLRCNGTARIQWGNTLIDLIKNGKITSSDSLKFIFLILEESEMESDGIYILNVEDTYKIFVYINKLKHILTESDLYISASNKLEITVEQQLTALKNLGIYYNTLEDVKNSGVVDGIAYVKNDKKFYIIKNKEPEEINSSSSTVTVDNNNNLLENLINNSVNILELTSLKSSAIRSLYTEETNSFQRGMIVMYLGNADIPEGWALCDGNTYEYNGVSVTTPNLINRFIYAVGSLSEIGELTISLNSGSEYELNSYSLIFIMKL